MDTVLEPSTSGYHTQSNMWIVIQYRLNNSVTKSVLLGSLEIDLPEKATTIHLRST